MKCYILFDFLATFRFQFRLPQNILYLFVGTHHSLLHHIHDTYNNIELIISDDCSKDNTVAICKEWINTHRGRFVRTEIVTTENVTNN